MTNSLGATVEDQPENPAGDRYLRLPPMANDWALGIATAPLPDGALPSATDSDPEATRNLLAYAAHAVQQVNASYFRFAVDGLGEHAEPTRLHLDRSTCTADLSLGLTSQHTTRKLTVLVALNPITIQIVGRSAADVSVAEGAIAVIPAYAAATLTPHTALGEARLLALHAVGDAFR